MFFKKKVPVSEYCQWSLISLFSKERAAAWEQLRSACADPALNQLNRDEYFSNVRAIILGLMLIAVTKKSSYEASFDARMYVGDYLREHGFLEIDRLLSEYAQAFGTLGGDGVEQLATRFSTKLTHSKMKDETVRRFVLEFYAISKGLFEEFNSIKLIAINK